MSKLFTYATSALLLVCSSCVIIATSLTAHAGLQCEDLFSNSPSITKNPQLKIEPMTVEVDGVRVSGERIKYMRANLDLTDALLEHLKENHLSVLSLGEGYSELLPYLIEKGITIKGLDLWYHSSNLVHENSAVVKKMNEFQNMFAAHLIRGSALDIPLKAESVDFVFSHRLLVSLHIAEQLRAITETIRVLTISGEAHLLLSDSRVPRKIDELAFKTILKFINENYAASVNAQILNGLLILSKVASTRTFDQLVIPFDEKSFYENLPTGSRARNESEEALIIKSYAAAVAALKRHPENPNIAAEVRILETKLNSFRKIDLTEQRGFKAWWANIMSRLTIKPDIRE